MAADKGKPKFIRKNGKIIPIRSDKATGKVKKTLNVAKSGKGKIPKGVKFSKQGNKKFKNVALGSANKRINKAKSGGRFKGAVAGAALGAASMFSTVKRSGLIGVAGMAAVAGIGALAGARVGGRMSERGQRRKELKGLSKTFKKIDRNTQDTGF